MGLTINGSIVVLPIIGKWKLILNPTKNIIWLLHAGCGEVHQPQFKNRTTCNHCQEEIPEEVLLKVRDNDFITNLRNFVRTQKNLTNFL